jgi:glycosyltransferase involved in cell wall biosynthesis
MKILLSAYACEPGKGSEPGVGWKWANGLASRVDLDVLTRESNRAVIEAEVDCSADGSALRSVRFHYHDLSAPFLWLKRRRLLPTIGYYFLWQWSVARRYQQVAEGADIVHHLTFCTLLCPGFWKLRKAAFVIGPVGAPLVNPYYIALFGGGAPIQRLRSWVMNRFLRLPWLKKTLRSAAAVVPANSETKGLLARYGIAAREVMLDTGAPESPPTQVPVAENETVCRFIYAGRIERRKALELALRAFALLKASSSCKNWCFTILGDGPDRLRLEKLAAKLLISDQVRFLDPVPHHQVLEHLQKSDVFVFTSVRDTSGGVNLEAMSCGLPILCIAHQGVGDITNDFCALRTAPASTEDTIRSLALDMKILVDSPAKRTEMGSIACQRAMDQFSWNAKFEAMSAIYESVLKEHRSNNL